MWQKEQYRAKLVTYLLELFIYSFLDEIFYFIFCGMTVFFLGMSISNAFAHHIRSSNLLSQFHAMPRFPRLVGIWMLVVRIRPVLEGILSAATTCWRVIVLEIGILKLLPYSWISEGRWVFESAQFWFFCIFLFQCTRFCFSYSLTVIWVTPNWLLFVFCYNCPVPFCRIHNLT